jgi:hypothetical protein
MARKKSPLSQRKLVSSLIRKASFHLEKFKVYANESLIKIEELLGLHKEICIHEITIEKKAAVLKKKRGKKAKKKSN